jgi:hypothetical protein
MSDLIGLLGATLSGFTGQVGLNCSPIGVAAISGGSSCTSQPVCCDGNNFSKFYADDLGRDGSNIFIL